MNEKPVWSLVQNERLVLEDELKPQKYAFSNRMPSSIARFSSGVTAAYRGKIGEGSRWLRLGNSLHGILYCLCWWIAKHMTEDTLLLQ